MTRYKDAILEYMEEHPEDFDEALELSVTDKKHLCWRAAWLVFHAMEPNDPRVQKKADEMIRVLPDRESGHQRELLKVLSSMKLEEEQETYLFDLCISLWEQVKLPPAVRYTAFKFLIQTCEKHPELANEVLSLAQPQHVNSLSPGIKNSIRKMLKSLENKSDPS